MNNSIFNVTFAGICPSLAYVGSINDYIDSKLWLKRQPALNYRYGPVSHYHFSRLSEAVRPVNFCKL